MTLEQPGLGSDPPNRSGRERGATKSHSNVPKGISGYTKQKQIHPSNLDRSITKRSKQPYHTDCQKRKQKKWRGRGGTRKEEEKVEEKEEYEILCLKTPLLSALHLDRCNFRGR